MVIFFQVISDVFPLFDKDHLLKMIKWLNVSAQTSILRQMSHSLGFTLVFDIIIWDIRIVQSPA